MKTTKEDYYVVGAGLKEGPVYLSEDGAMTARPNRARRFNSKADAEVALPEARAIPAAKDADWRVFGVHTETTIREA